MMFQQTYSHWSHFILYHIPQSSNWLYFYCFFNFECFDSFDHFAACFVPLIAKAPYPLIMWPRPQTIFGDLSVKGEKSKFTTESHKLLQGDVAELFL